MLTESGEVSRLEQANILGLAFVRTIILLNGGGILALLTYLGNASSQTQVAISVSSIKCAMALFLTGIVSVLVGLMISYTYTASFPKNSYAQFWNRWIIPTNAALLLISLVAFALAVTVLLHGAHGLPRS